ncbi:MAG: bacillithiol biosynthesis deacetylase BshB1 [Crocinitomicaceae bacterium]|nr:bacillithiol biosynthesis deacetylase BshB1 [Crocinitomicaceae bacterium]|tara:strand:+ start:4452 stop:5168 length:717 start_codon:yes stop_codon:yes gene_type:complete
MKLDILAFGAHPDDVELGASGSILSHIKQGKSVGVVDLTQGELGTRGSAAIRKQESEKASKILGLSSRTNLGLADGFFEESEESLLKAIEQIRRHKPEVVWCNAVEDRHPDHGRGSKLVSRACFLSGLVKIETKIDGQTQEPWRPKAVYHYIQDYYIKPDFIVDVSEHWEKRMEAVLAYSSQFYNPNSDEPESQISSKEFLKTIKGRARAFGRLIGTEYGEGFTLERPMGIQNMFDFI